MRIFQRIRALFGAGALDRDFSDELEIHLDLLSEDYRRRGLSPGEARRAAQLRLGGVAQLREAHRDARGLPLIDSFFQDVRYALRTLCKNPGFTALAVLTLAIGIGVNTAVFTLYDAAVLRPLPVADPDRLMQIARDGRLFSYPEFVYYRDHTRSLTGLVAMTTGALSMSGVNAPAPATGAGIAGAAGFHVPQVLGAAQPVTATIVSANYFQVLGVRASVGRTFRPEEDTDAAPPVAMLSDDFWERRFGRDPALLGQTLKLNGMDFTIVGIAPRGFGGTWLVVPDVWVPLPVYSHLIPAQDLLHNENNLCCRVYGRLRPGIVSAQAAAELNVLARNLPARSSDSDSRSPRHETGFVVGQATTGGQPAAKADIAAPLFLLGAVGLVLLIACANVASLLLARSAARQREIAIRLAIGAGRWRLVRQLLTENAVMSLLACGAGIVFSWWTLRFLMQLVASSPFAGVGTLALIFVPDHRVFLYLTFLSLASTLGFGLAPALEASRPNLTSGLRDEGAAFGGRMRKSRLRALLVGAQVAVCLVLLIAAGLLARASQRALTVDLGFDYRNVLSLEVVFPPSATPARIAATRTQLAQELSSLPEVQSLAVASRLPLVHGGMRSFAVAVNGGSVEQPGTPEAWYTLVTPSYFDTLGIAIVRGRNFTVQEAREGTSYDGSPVIVSEATARRFWPGEDPIGKRLAFGSPRGSERYSDGSEDAHSVSSFVVGIARDVRSWRIQSFDDTALYLPVTTSCGGTASGSSGRPMGVIVMRARAGEGAAVAAVQRALQSSHSDLQASIGDSRTAFTSQTNFVASRLGALAAAIIGILGLLMTSVGIYGTVGFAVTQRTQEIGIRMALGAARSSVLRMVLAETLRPVAIGLVIGFALAAVASRLMHSFLFGLSALDPLAFLGVSTFLAAVALLAGYVPARRATRVDPLVALRYE